MGLIGFIGLIGLIGFIGFILLIGFMGFTLLIGFIGFKGDFCFPESPIPFNYGIYRKL